MNKIRFTMTIFAFLALTLVGASVARAQATRTWVSGVGDDVNPCSRTAPCKTFAGAISKTADGGEIDALDPGGFGTVTITKSITIDGSGTFASILAAGTNGINVNDSGSGAPNTKVVTIRGISINGAGTGFTGINYTSGAELHVENVVISGFNGNGANSHGISINKTAGGSLFVQDTIIHNCSGNGINSTTTAGTIAGTIDNVRIERCANGINIVTNTNFDINRSVLFKNSSSGLAAAGSSVNNVDSTFISGNGVNGVLISGASAFVRMANCNITGNLANGVNIVGGNGQTYGDNKIKGNTSDITGGTLAPLGKN